ncbi:MAG TPA: VOC family protein [Solirubrobacteraceae bacterium]|nr:VOC family protein [Solirubrobacteraceae bacterium]
MSVAPHHVGLSVPDLDAAAAFWAAAFGFEPVLSFDLPGGVRGAMLRTPGGAGVELFEVPGASPGLAGADPPAAMRTRGLGHVAFEVADLDAAHARALAAGATNVWEPRPSPEPGRRMAFLHDPCGNLVEMIGPDESETRRG